MNVVAKTDIGLKRSENQDRILHQWLDDNTVLAVVCDGMGGENSGSVASELTITTFAQKVLAGYREDMDANTLRNLMLSAISATNAVVFEKAGTSEHMRGMGTTCVAVIARQSHAYIINIGDSRAYCINAAKIVQITKDHTMVRMLMEQGKITEADMKAHPQRNLITRAVGAEGNVLPDYFEWLLEEGDALLLCSDGLFGYAEEADIKEAVCGLAPKQAIQRMIALAHEGGGGDNISAVLITEFTRTHS